MKLRLMRRTAWILIAVMMVMVCGGCLDLTKIELIPREQGSGSNLTEWLTGMDESETEGGPETEAEAETSVLEGLENIPDTIPDVSGDPFTGLADGDDPEFNEFLMDYFREAVSADSLSLHYCVLNPEKYGIEVPEEVTFGEVDLDSLDQDLEDTRQFMDDLHDFDREALSDRQKLLYDILERNIDYALQMAEYPLYEVIFSPSGGFQAQLPIYMNEYTLTSLQDAEDYLSLLSQVDDYFEALMTVEQAKSEAGLFMADFTVDGIVSQCETFIEDPENNLLIDIFDDKLDAELPDLEASVREDLIERNREIVLTDVIPAYENLIKGLEDLKGTGKNDGGMANFEHGKEYYAMMAANNTGSSWTPEEMIRRCDKVVASAIWTFSLLSTQDENVIDEFYNFSPEIDDPADVLSDLQTLILSEFPEPVSKKFTVKYIHPSLEEDLNPAFYMIPQLDATDSNRIYINNYYNDGSDNSEFYSTLSHEGYPGHLYQITWFRSENPHPVYRLFSDGGYSEGWATYVERQSYAWAGASESVAAALIANADFGLAISARCDLGVNYEGWDREDTAEYLSNYGLDDSETVDSIFEYVVAEPAVYLDYFIGYQEFKDLRSAAESELGDRFDPVEYHRFLLDLGPAPFDIVRSYLAAWIRQQ